MRSLLLVLAGAAAFALALGAAPQYAVAQDPPPAEEAKKARHALMATYDRGLDFLATQQKDGVFDAYPGTPSPELTAIAAACFFNRPDGCREKDRDVAARSADYLIGRVDADGLVKDARTQNYAVSAVILALVSSGRKDAKPAIDRCIQRIRTFQLLDRKDPNFGGISYGPGSSRADVSNTQYALASLRAAGVPADDPVFKNAVEFLQRCQNRTENETAGAPTSESDAEGKPVARGNDGGGVYRPGGGPSGYDTRPDGTRVPRSYGSMTYSLLRCYHLAGLPATDGRVKAAAGWISSNFALDHNPGMPEASKLEGLYYMYDAMARSLSAVGVRTIEKDGKQVDWRKALAEHLAAKQAANGSWLNQADSKFMENHPVVASSLALSALGAAAK